MAIVFKEEGHIYESTDADKIKWTSVTGFIGMFKPKFDAKAQAKSVRSALHTECAGYTASKRNTKKAKINQQAEDDAKEEYYSIQEFEKRQIKNGHKWEPTTGKDWTREKKSCRRCRCRWLALSIRFGA